MTAQLFLFGEDFGSMAKGKLEAAAVLKKAAYPQSNKGKLGFQGDYPCKGQLEQLSTKLQSWNLNWWSSLDRLLIVDSPLHPWTPNMTIESDASNQGSMVNNRGLKSHKLPRATSSLFSAAVFCETEAQHHYYPENGQCHSSDIHKQNGGTHSQGLMELVPAAEHISNCRTPTREGEHSRRRGIQEYEGPLRFCLQADTNTDGAIRDRLFMSHLTKQLPRFYSWRPDLETENMDAFSHDWSKVRSFEQRGRAVMITPLWITQLWYPTILEMLDNYRRLLPAIPNLVILLTVQDTFIMKQGVLELVAWAISRNPSHHEEFLQNLQISSCPPGEVQLQLTLNL